MTVQLDTLKLDLILATHEDIVDAVMYDTALGAEATAKQLARVDTGTYRNSIHVEKQKNGEYWLMDGVLYGIFLELGTRFMGPFPAFIPATEREANFLGQRFVMAMGAYR